MFHDFAELFFMVDNIFILVREILFRGSKIFTFSRNLISQKNVKPRKFLTMKYLLYLIV